MKLIVLPLLLLLRTTAVAQRLDFSQYIIQNSCPYPIELWNGSYGTFQGVIPAYGNVTYFLDLDSGPFWTDAHCGDPMGYTSTKAFFHLSVSALSLSMMEQH